ncbi:MAG TPA: DinB family protein [Nocardioides sp.]|uniref:DinB family protein n=1 Tax=Nocardioides sp. TaxID=35761 RepID=UPI002F3E411A
MADQLQVLSDAAYDHLRLRGATFAWIDLAGAEVRHAGLRDVRMRGVELQDVEIDGELLNVVINGVDVAPLVEAELERRDPDYAKMKPADAAGFREAWEILERRWADTVDRARDLDPDLLHERVDGEWSFVETLRHLCYATDAWVSRVYLGDPDPWSPLDLPFDSMRDWPWPYEMDVRPSLDEVLALRADRQATVRRVLAELTDERLGEKTSAVEGDGWPPPDSYDVCEALGIVVNEEWHHRRYAERDLAALESRSGSSA